MSEIETVEIGDQQQLTTMYTHAFSNTFCGISKQRLCNCIESTIATKYHHFPAGLCQIIANMAYQPFNLQLFFDNIGPFCSSYKDDPTPVLATPVTVFIYHKIENVSNNKDVQKKFINELKQDILAHAKKKDANICNQSFESLDRRILKLNKNELCQWWAYYCGLAKSWL